MKAALLAVALLGLVAAADADPAVRLKVSRSIVAGHVAQRAFEWRRSTSGRGRLGSP